MFTYIYICIDMFTYIYICIDIYMYICIYMYVCTYVCMYISVSLSLSSFHDTAKIQRLPPYPYLILIPSDSAMHSDSLPCVGWFDAF